MPTDLSRYVRQSHSWPKPQTFYLTLDLECDYGTAIQNNVYEAVEHVDTLVKILERHSTPLTCFVQTELLERRPEVVETLDSAVVPVSFHPHSHTHAKRTETDIEREIALSTEAYSSFFGENPVGYRFPDGDIRNSDYRLLAKYGYAFDASVFPSWRPGRFNNIGTINSPAYVLNGSLLEIPFTIFRENVPLPTSLSYCQLFGYPYTQLLTRLPPSTVVFNVHMHDLIRPSTYANLPRRYKAVYARSENGFRLLNKILDQFRSHGHSFELLDDTLEQFPSPTR